MRPSRHTPEHRSVSATHVIPRLRERMADKQASSQALADRAGVSRDIVTYARQGFPVKPAFAEWIETALNNFDYAYLKPGRRAA